MSRESADDRAYRETWLTVLEWEARPGLPTWRPIESRPEGRGRRQNMAWASDAFPGVVIRHCGHPTALRPYWLDGRQVDRKFSTLALAQAAIAALAAGAIEERNL